VKVAERAARPAPPASNSLEDSGLVEVSINVKRVIASPPPAPKLLTKLSFSRIGPDFCLEAGFIDPVEMRLALEAARSGDADKNSASLYVTDRFMVPVGALPDLLASLKQLVSGLETVLKPLEESAEPLSRKVG